MNSSKQADSGKLPRRSLGNRLEVSAMGYGAMGMSEFYGPSDDAQSLAMLNEVADAGVTMIDTADMYGRGHNESLIGRFLASRHASAEARTLRIATKCGIQRAPDSGYARGINNEPEYIRACCEASLRRLGVECIDLFYIHRVDPKADIAATMDTLRQLVEEGKMAHVGLCEVSGSTLEKAHGVFPVTALQSEYSLWSRDIEDDSLAAARRLGIGLVAYSPLGRGFLTGRIGSTSHLSESDFRRHNPRFQGANLTHNLHLLEAVRSIANEHDAAPAQIALAWLLAQGDDVVPIPGTRHVRYLHENLGALDVSLTRQELTELDQALSPANIRGSRYGEEGMKGINA